MNVLQTVVLGTVEGITEFLPISSTGHLILTSKLLGLAQSDFLKSFEIAIQLGAVLAVVGLYWRRFLDATTFVRVVTAFIPTAIVGFVLYKVIKSVLIGNLAIVAWALLLGGGVMLLVEWRGAAANPRPEASPGTPATAPAITLPTTRQALLIGLAQSLAVIPGVSRSAATIVAGLSLGMSRQSIVEFSFLLAVPTLAAATALDLLKSADTFTAHTAGLLAIGFVVAGVTAFVAVRWLLRYISTNTFRPFAYYRIVLGLVLLLLFR